MYNIVPHGSYTDRLGEKHPVYRISGISVDEFNLTKTIYSEQVFRWRGLGRNAFIGGTKDHLALFRQIIHPNGSTHLITTATPAEFTGLWRQYFGLQINYNEELDKLKLTDFALRAYQTQKGIKILRQDPWEALITFLLLQHTSTGAARNVLDRLCVLFPENCRKKFGYVWFKFPSPEDILSLGRADLQHLGASYRTSYIVCAARDVIDGYIDLYSMNNPNIATADIVYELKYLQGVGDWVANCVALMGFGRLNAFPFDLWMDRIIACYYPDGINRLSFGRIAGVIQQYMLYTIRDEFDYE